MLLRLPAVQFITADLAGTVASPAAVAGADVMPWRPALGVYLVIENGQAPSGALADVPGVAGAWWYHGNLAPVPHDGDFRGVQVTYCYLDEDPLQVAVPLGAALRRRWASGDVQGLLAAPFYTVVPFDWARHLPAGMTE
jgi:hypothetical protein